MEHLEVFEEDRAHWRWRFTDGNGIAVLSNYTYDDADEAEAAARSAYPDLDVESDYEEPPEKLARDTKDILVIVAAVLVALGIIWWRRRSNDVAEDVS
jgi:hypothetical protein